MYKIGRDVEVQDRTDARAIVSLIGPRAGFVLAGATSGEQRRMPSGENEWTEARIAGEPVMAAATDVGLDVIYDARAREAVVDALSEAGAVPVEEAAAEVVRIERGRPRYGIDMTDDNLPGELGLEERAVSFTKGCYVGQEPVARMYHRGHPNRILRGLRLTEPATAGEPLVRDGKEVGKVTSAGVSPRLGPIALAVVRREVEPGGEVVVGERRGATVVELPFETV
jgi:folate-binding protein YgfZ